MTANEASSVEADRRLTQLDWCDAPQPGNWRNACMREPGHEGPHAVRKPYALMDAWVWHGDTYPVTWRNADVFPDLWHPDNDRSAATPPEGGTTEGPGG